MTKSELIEKIAAKNPHLMLKDVERIVAVVFDALFQLWPKAKESNSEVLGLSLSATAVPALPKIREPANASKWKKEESRISKSESSCLNF